MLPAKAYLEYTELVQKHYGFKPRIEDIQSQADALVNLVQTMLEKNEHGGKSKYDSN